MSKLSKLKQQAYQAGKRRNWVEAVSIYESILEVDKNNPTLINELGDICLKTGDNERAVRHFLNAANKYRGTGLLNNAVAIYKKILRHDEGNVNAHWYLAEIRSSQGLSVEGERHAMRFLESSDNQAGEIKEIFLKRCEQLLGLYPVSPTVLDRLLGIFRVRKMAIEQARVQMLQACLLFDQGEIDTARQAVEDLVGSIPGLTNYPEYTAWRGRTGGGDGAPRISSVNEIDIGATDSAAQGGDAGGEVVEITPQEDLVADAPAPPDSAGPQMVEAIEPVAAETDSASVAATPEATPEATPKTIPEAKTSAPAANGFGDIDVNETAAAKPGTAESDGTADSDVAKDDDGCINIDVGGDTTFEDLMADLESVADKVATDEPGGTETASDGGAEASGGVAAGDAIEGDAEEEAQEVDLLAKILAEDGGDLAAAEAGQVDTIAAEIGVQVGGGEDQSPYDLGMVYLEMGMFDLASDNFACAVDVDDRTISAYEMWGISLLRAGRPAEAVEVFGKGLAMSVEAPTEHLGLLYHAGLAHEESGEFDLARDFYVKTHQIKSDFLDVAKRLESLGVA